MATIHPRFPFCLPRMAPYIHPRAAESTTPPVIIGAELRQILDRFWIDIGTDEELDDGPDRLPPVTAFTVTMRARKCGNPVSWNRKSLDGYFNGFLSPMSAAGPVSGGYTALRRSPRRGTLGTSCGVWSESSPPGHARRS